MGASSISSSDIDDEQAERLRSVAIDSATVFGAASSSRKRKKDRLRDNHTSGDGDGGGGAGSSALKFYQARARDLLHEYLDTTFEIKSFKHKGSEDPNTHCSKDVEDIGFRLFRCAPPGLSDKRSCREAVSTKKKRKHQDDDLDESSEMFQSSLLAAAIDGAAVKASAEKAVAKAFSSWLSHEAEEKEAKRKEDERVALVKMQRGEEWLPSIARDMAMDEVFDGNLLTRVTKTHTKTC